MVNDFLVHKIVEASDMNWPFCWFRPGGKFGYGWDLRFKFEFWIKWNKNTSIKFLNYIIINTIEYRAATAAKDAKDWSLPSFGSHLNPISTKGGRLCPPYTGVLGWLKFAVAALLAGVSLPKLEFILTVFSTWYITFWLWFNLDLVIPAELDDFRQTFSTVYFHLFYGK